MKLKSPSRLLYHGGVAGLKVGDRLLPPDATGAATEAQLLDAVGMRLICRRDRVYVTATLDIARLYAALRACGDVYEVEVDQPLERDGAAMVLADETSYVCPAATIVAVVERAVPLSVARRIMAGELKAIEALVARES